MGLEPTATRLKVERSKIHLSYKGMRLYGYELLRLSPCNNELLTLVLLTNMLFPFCALLSGAILYYLDPNNPLLDCGPKPYIVHTVTSESIDSPLYRCPLCNQNV